MDKSNSSPKDALKSKARLTLQDPRDREEPQFPSLRLSKEISVNSESQLTSEQAKNIWQTMQLKSEDAILQIEQLKLATENAALDGKKIKNLQNENAQLKLQVIEQQTTRWQHPLVYGAGAAFLGLGYLWLSERKKKIVAQEHFLELPNSMSSVLGMPEGPLVNFSESVAKSWQDSIPSLPDQQSTMVTDAKNSSSTPELISDPISDSILQADLLPYSPRRQPAAELELAESSSPWWKRLKRKNRQHGVDISAGNEATTAYPSTQTPIHNTEIQIYDDNGLQDMQAPDANTVQAIASNIHDPNIANVELLTETRIKPASTDDAMGHLLEIRMAVQALCALEQSPAAQELLEKHISAVPNTCAWAYMQYLDLSAQLGQRDAFEAMRKRYRLQFNRLAPYWMEPNAAVQTLDTYERPMVELNAAWASHDQARTLISTWLLGTLHSRRLFQLPAYHDLFDLYEMLEFYDVERGAPDWVPTVSLLDLDYEFAIEVKIEAQSEQDAVRVIPAVKTGDFAVDFNVTANPTQPGALTAIPDTPSLAMPSSLR